MFVCEIVTVRLCLRPRLRLPLFASVCLHVFQGVCMVGRSCARMHIRTHAYLRQQPRRALGTCMSTVNEARIDEKMTVPKIKKTHVTLRSIELVGRMSPKPIVAHTTTAK
jgi:hypothetical protein